MTGEAQTIGMGVMTMLEERVTRSKEHISEIRTHFATKADLWRAVAIVVAANAVVNFAIAIAARLLLP